MFCCTLPLPLLSPDQSHRDFSQRNALDGGPDDGQATHLGGEHVDLVGPLTDIAEQTLDRLSRLHIGHVRMHPVDSHPMAQIVRKHVPEQWLWNHFLH